MSLMKLSRGFCLALVGAMMCTTAMHAQLREARTGPVIAGFGAVYSVPDATFPLPADADYRVVFDVSAAPDDPGTINSRINTLARFLNMHAEAGIEPGRMHLALVLHGPAGKAALDDTAHRERFGTGNPDLPLLTALHDAGVEIILCGQTAVHREYRTRDLAAPVTLALSAMTALVELQSRGYQLIAF